MTSNTKNPRRSYVPTGLYDGKSAEERRTERKKLLVEKGIELIGTRGFASVSLNMLCTEAGLTKRYFYESFESMEEVLSEAFNCIFAEMQTVLMQQMASHQTPKAIITESIRGFYEYLRSNPTRGRVFLIESLSVQLSRDSYFDDSRISGLLMLTSQQFVGQTKLSETVFPILAQSAVGATRFVGQKWIETGFAQPIDELVEGVSQVCFGIGKQLGVDLDASP